MMKFIIGFFAPLVFMFGIIAILLFLIAPTLIGLNYFPQSVWPVLINIVWLLTISGLVTAWRC